MCIAYPLVELKIYKTTHTTVSIPPNGYMFIPGKSTDVLKIHTSMARVSSTANSKLTDIIEITPLCLFFYINRCK